MGLGLPLQQRTTFPWEAKRTKQRPTSQHSHIHRPVTQVTPRRAPSRPPRPPCCQGSSAGAGAQGRHRARTGDAAGTEEGSMRRFETIPKFVSSECVACITAYSSPWSDLDLRWPSPPIRFASPLSPRTPALRVPGVPDGEPPVRCARQDAPGRETRTSSAFVATPAKRDAAADACVPSPLSLPPLAIGGAFPACPASQPASARDRAYRTFFLNHFSICRQHAPTCQGPRLPAVRQDSVAPCDDLLSHTSATRKYTNRRVHMSKV